MWRLWTLVLAAAIACATNEDERVELVASSRGLPDASVAPEEALRRAAARARISSSLCESVGEAEDVGCVQEDNIVAAASFPVTFQHETSGANPEKCWVSYCI
jgi:hypothetical protein